MSHGTLGEHNRLITAALGCNQNRDHALFFTDVIPFVRKFTVFGLNKGKSDGRFPLQELNAGQTVLWRNVHWGILKL